MIRLRTAPTQSLGNVAASRQPFDGIDLERRARSELAEARQTVSGQHCISSGERLGVDSRNGEQHLASHLRGQRGEHRKHDGPRDRTDEDGAEEAERAERSGQHQQSEADVRDNR